MFEKSLYDLIRGLRNHKGNEAEYIQNSLKECRSEIRSQDMDLKAIALLKLIYLEMFGYDMSWASFHVLEVMSSAKYLQKRVGYLGAVQSFRPDTEVLMLATNLLKKDLGSASIPTMSLPISTLPHIITSSLALSLLTDLLPRLSHSHPTVRKKTVVTLYRLALVYPETLRIAWPKIKERLMDNQEDSTVTAAVINVVCELGWRRPHDFLPLAPRLFDLLVEGGNNWMAIKIIKLFATLTPLEPRLVRKLLRPLINIIETTSAMSLLYECINGVIQGGILDGTENVSEGDKIATLCVDKLRSMIVVEGDPNLKYVALLAFNKIVVSHPDLVSLQQDVIMDCLDDHDVSIRLQALELVSGMVNGDTIQSVVSRLLKQLQGSPMVVDRPSLDLAPSTPIQPAADSDGEDPEEQLASAKTLLEKSPPLPNEYRRDVVSRILDICSRDTYANIVDFEWYVDTLVQLVRHVPPQGPQTFGEREAQAAEQNQDYVADLANRIGLELQNVAVRVKGVRSEATHAAESLISIIKRDSLFPATGSGGQGVLEPAAWIVGEYAEYLVSPRETLNSLVHQTSRSLPAIILCAYLQAIPKLLTEITRHNNSSWNTLRKSSTSLLISRVVEFLESLSDHPSLDVQERAIEFLELLRLAGEALSTQQGDNEDPPLLLTSAIPSLFTGLELNPVAVGAQKKVPQPDNLDLDIPINANLSMLLQVGDAVEIEDMDHDETYVFYNERIPVTKEKVHLGRMEIEQSDSTSYQNTPEAVEEDPQLAARKRAERRERNKDDPFYIAGEGGSGRSTPFHQILKTSNGDDFDLDSIPIIDLDLDGGTRESSGIQGEQQAKKKKKKAPRKFEIAADETLDFEEPSSGDSRPRSLEKGSGFLGTKVAKTRRNLLQVDSSGLGQLSLDSDSGASGNFQHEIERREAEEAEMAKAMAEVERLRLEMQRASERVEAAGIPSDGTLVKKKKKKKVVKKEPVAEDEPASIPGEGEAVVKKKKKKKRKEGPEPQAHTEE